MLLGVRHAAQAVFLCDAGTFSAHGGRKSIDEPPQVKVGVLSQGRFSAPPGAGDSPVCVPQPAGLCPPINPDDITAAVLEFVSQYVDLKPTASGAIGLLP